MPERITLAAARVNAGISQKDAAKLLGVSPSTLRNYESGKTSPGWDTVRKIEKAYGISIDYIFLP